MCGVVWCGDGGKKTGSLFCWNVYMEQTTSCKKFDEKDNKIDKVRVAE